MTNAVEMADEIGRVFQHYFMLANEEETTVVQVIEDTRCVLLRLAKLYEADLRSRGVELP